MILLLPWSFFNMGDGEITAYTTVGIEYTLPVNRPHYALPINKLHYTLPDED